MLSLRWQAAIGMVLAFWIGLLVILAWVGAGTRSGVGKGAERLKIGPEASLEALSAMRYRQGIGGTCLWSYFFVDPDRQRLERAVQALKSDVYRVVAISGPVQREAGLRFILHVEKREHYRLAQLHVGEEQSPPCICSRARHRELRRNGSRFSS